MKKYYNLLIDDQAIPFFEIEVDPDTQNPITEELKMYDNMCSLANNFMNISGFPYEPILGSTWNGKDFYHKNGVEEIDSSIKGLTRIAFLNGSEYLGRILYNETSKAKMFVSILISDPKIVLDRIE